MPLLPPAPVCMYVCVHTCVYEYVCAHVYSVHVCRYVHIVCTCMCIRVCVNLWLSPLSLGGPQVPFIKKLHLDSFLLALFLKAVLAPFLRGLP